MNRMKWKRQEENANCAYRIIRVGGEEASEVYRFTTGKSCKAVFGITALPEAEDGDGENPEWNEKLDDLKKATGDLDFFAVIGKDTSRDEQAKANDFYLTDCDITVISIYDADEADSAEYIQRVRRETKRTWTVLLLPDLRSAKLFLDAGANVVAQRTKEGNILVSYKVYGEIHTFEAGFAEVAGYEKQLELEYFDRDGVFLGALALK